MHPQGRSRWIGAVGVLVGLAAGLPGGEATSGWAWLHPGLARIETRLQDLEAALAGLPRADRPQYSERAGYHSGYLRSQTAPCQVTIDLGRSQEFTSVAVVPAFSATAGDGPYGFPPRFRIEVANEPDFTDAQVISDHTGDDFAPGVAPVFVATPGMTARYVRFVPTRLCPVMGDPGHWFFCLGEVLLFADGSNVARRAPVICSSEKPNHPVWDRLFITDGNAGLGFPVIPGIPGFNGWCSALAARPDERKWVQVTFPASAVLTELRLFPLHHPRFPERSAYGFPADFRIEVAADDAFTQGVRTIYTPPRDYTGPGDNPLPINLLGSPARAARITANRLWRGAEHYLFALSEIEVYATGRATPLPGRVTTSDDLGDPEWSREALTDGRVANGPLIPWETWLAGLARRQELAAERAALLPQQQAARREAQQRAAMLGVAVLLVAGVGGILLAWRARRRRAQELADLRERIARDLHDEIGSHLGTIALMSEMAQRPGADALAALAEIRTLSQEAGTSMRGIVWLVREPGRPSLHRLAEILHQTAGTILRDLAWTFTLPPDDARPAVLDLDGHRHVYLFFREALHNIVRHAQARTVDIRFAWDARGITLEIRDDGRGFDPETIVPGSGLANLRHRAAVLHGTMALITRPGSGTRITLEIPWP